MGMTLSEFIQAYRITMDCDLSNQSPYPFLKEFDGYYHICRLKFSDFLGRSTAPRFLTVPMRSNNPSSVKIVQLWRCPRCGRVLETVLTENGKDVRVPLHHLQEQTQKGEYPVCDSSGRILPSPKTARKPRSSISAREVMLTVARESLLYEIARCPRGDEVFDYEPEYWKLLVELASADQIIQLPDNWTGIYDAVARQAQALRIFLEGYEAALTKNPTTYFALLFRVDELAKYGYKVNLRAKERGLLDLQDPTGNVYHEGWCSRFGKGIVD